MSSTPAMKLADGVMAMRPFLPAKNFAASISFYGDLGFDIENFGPDVAQLHLGTHCFLLQDFYVAAWADNFVMHMLVDDIAAWWSHVASLDLAARHGVAPPQPPKREPWGLDVIYVVDPSGVLWHIASRPPI